MILPCPFCGEPGELRHAAGSYGYYPGSWGCGCTKCNVHTRSFDDEVWEQGKGHRSIHDEAKAAAIAAWNTRYAPPAHGLDTKDDKEVP